MSDTTRELLVRGVAAAKAKENKEARFYLEWMLRLEPTIEERMEAWYWFSQVSDDFKEKRGYLEDILANNPGDARARKALAILEGKLDPQKIINPDMLPMDATAPQAGQDRMVCPQCGGKMTFTPDGTSLTCEFCSSRKQLATADKSPVGEEDFLLALATQKGHLQTFQSQTQTCQGCGARFFLNPQQISSTCPYCDSSHVITDQSNQDIIIPNSLIPFKLNERMARSVFSDWLKKNLNEDEIERTSGKGIYIPIWTFDVGGSINWTYEIYKNKRWIPLSDAKLLLVNDLPIPASQNFEQIPAQLTQSFDLDQLVPFDPGYLSSWMAETHDASLSEASLRARQITLQNERVAINAGISEQSRNLTIRSDQMMIDSYRLALIPVWVCHYWLKGKRYDVFLNGDSGEVFGDLPLLNPRRWLAGFF